MYLVLYILCNVQYLYTAAVSILGNNVRKVTIRTSVSFAPPPPATPVFYPSAAKRTPSRRRAVAHAVWQCPRAVSGNRSWRCRGSGGWRRGFHGRGGHDPVGEICNSMFDTSSLRSSYRSKMRRDIYTYVC